MSNEIVKLSKITKKFSEVDKSIIVLKNINNVVNLDIIDNGIGINKAEMGKIFEPYYTTKEKGTGLGLSICKKIIEDHGGEISIKKNKSIGSTVSLKLII